MKKRKPPKPKTQLTGAQVLDRRCPTCNHKLPPSIGDVVQKADHATIYEGITKTLEGFEVLVIRSMRHNRDLLKPIYKALRKRFPKWKGQLLHLRPGEEISHLPIGAVQDIYEGLLVRFDPDLYKIREERKKKALEEEKEREKLENLKSAHDTADYLERVRKASGQDPIRNVAEATIHLEDAKKAGELERQATRDVEQASGDISESSCRVGSSERLSD